MFQTIYVGRFADLNSTANSISAANDMTSLAPKYINILRGQVISMTVSPSSYYLPIIHLPLAHPVREVDIRADFTDWGIWLRPLEGTGKRGVFRK